MKNVGFSFNNFTHSKLKRLLNAGGQEFTFTKFKTNQYGESTQEIDKQVTILGVSHIFNGGNTISISKSSENSSSVRSKHFIGILTFWNSFGDYSGASSLEPGMSIVIENEIHKIVKSENLANAGVAAEISLEVYDSWQT